MPAAAIRDDESPPMTVPRLQSPWSRFITGAWRRALSHEPCRFMATSTRTSKVSMPTNPASRTSGVVANPTTASDSETTVPAAMMARVGSRPC